MTQRFFHRTSEEAARNIVTGGFRDGTGDYLIPGEEFTGVWLSDRPLGANDGASGDTLLAVDIEPDLVEPHEWIEEDKAYREFLVPASVLNQHARVQIVPGDDV